MTVIQCFNGKASVYDLSGNLIHEGETIMLHLQRKEETINLDFFTLTTFGESITEVTDMVICDYILGLHQLTRSRDSRYYCRIPVSKYRHQPNYCCIELERQEGGTTIRYQTENSIYAFETKFTLDNLRLGLEL